MASSDVFFSQTHDKRFYGIYRGVVVNNVDPLNLNRLQVKVPQVTGDAVTNWASPCLRGNPLGVNVPGGIYAAGFNTATTTAVQASRTTAFTSVKFDTMTQSGGFSLDGTGTKVSVSLA